MKFIMRFLILVLTIINLLAGTSVTMSASPSTVMSPRGALMERLFPLRADLWKNDANILAIVNGTSYDINDSAWINAKNNINRNTIAFKVFSAFNMLGYNVATAAASLHPQIILNKFQKRYSLPVTSIVTAPVIKKMDELLVARESSYAVWGPQFPLYGHLQPLHPNDASKDFVATLFTLPLKMLPAVLWSGEYETLQCVAEQCAGSIKNSSGSDWTSRPVDPSADYRFTAPYFDPWLQYSRVLNATISMETVLHEYAHYLDNSLYPNPGAAKKTQPHLGMINTKTFNALSFDQNSGPTCFKRLSDDPKNFISRYGFLSQPGCPTGTYLSSEEFAEAFQMYVASGKQFRAAAGQNNVIAKKYSWLKSNVFGGREYDTDWVQDTFNGCADAPGHETDPYTYMSCSEDYVWDGELRLLQTPKLLSPRRPQF